MPQRHGAWPIHSPASYHFYNFSSLVLGHLLPHLLEPWTPPSPSQDGSARICSVDGSAGSSLLPTPIQVSSLSWCEICNTLGDCHL